MPEPNVKRYPISTPSPNLIKLSDFGLARSIDGDDMAFETTIRGEVSLEEFKAMFGPDHNIVEAMAYSSTSRDGWAITVTAEDVLAAEGTNTMQHLIIDGLLAQMGLAQWKQARSGTELWASTRSARTRCCS